MNVNPKRSLLLSVAIEAELRACYSNALKGLFWLDGQGIRATYVEGWAIENALPLPLSHGWLYCEGQIVDPTWLSDRMQSNHYVPSVEYTIEDVSFLLDNKGSVRTPLLCYALKGKKRAAAKEAHKEAYRQAMFHCLGIKPPTD